MRQQRARQPGLLLVEHRHGEAERGHTAEVTGRGEGLGRPLLYGTTALFLEQFALRHLEELPRVDELAIALRREPQPL